MVFTEKLRSGEFIVTAEISPPKGFDISASLYEAQLLRDLVDAVNVTDNQRAVMRMAPMALCHRLTELDLEPIMHITCRDRNRLALQSDLLAAHALGIKNMLVMSGDFTTMGDQPDAKPVFDLDSVQLLQLIEKMNSGYDFQDNSLDDPTSFCAGAVANPGSEPLTLHLIKLNKKAGVGARFIQTQAVFDTSNFKEFMAAVKHLDIPVIAGIMPLRSAHNARFVNERIPGIRIPGSIIQRMESAAEPVVEGLEIAAETIQDIQSICRGVHIMPIRGNENTRRLLELSGLA